MNFEDWKADLARLIAATPALVNDQWGGRVVRELLLSAILVAVHRGVSGDDWLSACKGIWDIVADNTQKHGVVLPPPKKGLIKL